MRVDFLWLFVLLLATCAPGCDSDRKQPALAPKPPATPTLPNTASANNHVTSTSVSLYQDKVTLDELVNRGDSSSIQRLDAGHAKLTDEDMALLAEFSGLKNLKLNVNSSITDDGLQHLKKLPELQNLSLFYCPQLTGAGFVHLQNLDNLTVLNIGNNKNITDDNLKHLQKLKGLQTLDASPLWGTTDEGLKHVSQIQGLQSLKIQSREFTDQGIEHLAALKNLTRLHLNPGSPEQSQLTSEGIAKLKQALPECSIYHANER